VRVLCVSALSALLPYAVVCARVCLLKPCVGAQRTSELLEFCVATRTSSRSALGSHVQLHDRAPRVPSRTNVRLLAPSLFCVCFFAGVCARVCFKRAFVLSLRVWFYCVRAWFALSELRNAALSVSMSAYEGVYGTPSRTSLARVNYARLPLTPPVDAAL
jgi:hypothetical protein